MDRFKVIVPIKVNQDGNYFTISVGEIIESVSYESWGAYYKYNGLTFSLKSSESCNWIINWGG